MTQFLSGLRARDGNARDAPLRRSEAVTNTLESSVPAIEPAVEAEGSCPPRGQGDRPRIEGVC